MRRQTLGPMSGSTLNSRASLGRPSLGGRKASLGAPRMSMGAAPATEENRYPMDETPAPSARRSSVASSRRSSAYGVRGAADPRPLGDKQWMSDAIRTLIDHLLNTGYPERMDVAANKGWRPTGRDFQSICCFLFKQVDSNWTSGAKFEDEFIMVFKTLGYPYTISKTSLSAVGSPHAWPQLLAALEWLVELLTYDADAADGHGTNAGFDGDGSAGDDLTRAGDLRFIEYLGVAYQAFLSGDDAGYDRLEQEFSASFDAQTSECSELVATREAEQARLMKEIEQHKAVGLTLPAKREKLAVLESDHEKLCDFVEKLREHSNTLEAKVKSKEADLAAQKELVEAAKDSKEQLKSRVSTQELSADEALRMVAERERLERTLNEATAYHAAQRQQAWEADMELSRRTEELERSVHAYTAQATSLQLLPKGSKNAKGIDFRMVPNTERIPTAGSLADVLKTDVHGEIMPALANFKELVTRKCAELRANGNLLLDQEEHSAEALEEATDALEALQAKHAKLEDALKREKEDLEATLAERSAEARTIEQAFEELRDNPAERERKKVLQTQRMAELRSQLAEQQEKHDADAGRAQEMVLAALGQLADYKAHVGRQVASLKQHYAAREAALSSL